MTAEYRIAENRLGGERTLVVSAPDGTARAVLALSGATLLSWQVRSEATGRLTELTDGYRDDKELLVQDGVRAGLLAPFPNRVADGRYHHADQDHDLLPGHHGDRLIYHGFAREAPFELAHATTTADSARLLLHTTSIRPGRYPGYPFAIDLAVEYTLTARELGITIRATNVGGSTAPYAAGWHPYFTLSRPIDDLTLHIPAHTLIRTDAALIPLPGEDALLPLDNCPGMDFRTPKQLSDAVIDACYADLTPGPAGRIETVLTNSATGEELRVWQHSGYMHVFTGDTLARDRRASIALEPVETMTNAFNRPEHAAALALEPGRSRAFAFGVEYAVP
ncbi:MAG: aldose 1-epimerase [Streptomyces sp.]|uniref:aldose 1-epimerase n=1 Tax=Streptomyces sp. TaxID=1931 RepID=UPI0025EB1745|nr:aldose 1-epimerase [Streptomyces sp.]MBW8794198.1 aldose 1-epimerase [Streptomyces sp.]